MRNTIALVDTDRSDLAVMQRGDVVLHLHRFENKQDIALFDSLSGLDIDFLDHARDRGGNGLTAGGGGSGCALRGGRCGSRSSSGQDETGIGPSEGKAV